MARAPCIKDDDETRGIEYMSACREYGWRDLFPLALANTYVHLTGSAIASETLH
jgi:hypothetical protein